MMKSPDAEHLRVLWRMEREKRVEVWRRLGQFEDMEEELELELELGGAWRCECPIDKEELFMLLPGGEGALARLRVLSLWWCEDQVDDGILRALVSAGCGKELTSLSLAGVLLCSCL